MSDTITAQPSLNASSNGVQAVPRWASRITRWLAALVALSTLLLIAVGGTVTSTRSGDTEPTWSIKFWEWFEPLGTYTGGHFIEMSHRQIGTIVGFLMITLVAFLWKTEKRKWVRRTGYLALLLVVAQGALGGLRVLVVHDPAVQGAALEMTGASHAGTLRAIFAMIHGTAGPIIFALMVGIMAATSRNWMKQGCISNTVTIAAIRQLGLIALVLIVAQIILGTVLRHFGWVIPAVLVHVLGAFLVAYYTIYIAYKAGSLSAEEAAAIRRPAMGIALIVQFQILLGVFSYVMPISLSVRTFHQVMGSIILALAFLLVLRAFNLLRPEEKLQMQLFEESS